MGRIKSFHWSHSQSAMALTGVRIILIFLGLNLIQTKHLLVETEDETGNDYKVKRHGFVNWVDFVVKPSSWGNSKGFDKFFNNADKDDNGAVSMKEITAEFKQVGGMYFSEEEAQEAFKRIDKNGNGVLEIDEFYEADDGKGFQV